MTLQEELVFMLKEATRLMPTRGKGRDAFLTRAFEVLGRARVELPDHGKRAGDPQTYDAWKLEDGEIVLIAGIIDGQVHYGNGKKVPIQDWSSEATLIWRKPDTKGTVGQSTRLVCNRCSLPFETLKSLEGHTCQ